MNREKIVESILAQIRYEDHRAVRQCLKYLSDTNLLSYAIDIGINTDAILLEGMQP